jgi:hypothetical protein
MADLYPLALLLCSRYRRALGIKSTLQALEATMRELGVNTHLEFEQWLEKEKAHLRTLSKEPLQETLEMEYYQKLVNLQDVEYVPFISFPFAPSDLLLLENASRQYSGYTRPLYSKITPAMPRQHKQPGV